MGVVTKFKEVDVMLLKPYESNAKIHTEEQISKLVSSIKEFGFVSPCLIDKDHNIIAGHGRVMAALEMGLDKVPCVFVEGLTDEQRRAYILADNRLSELALWDKELISNELEMLRAENFDITLTGFDVDDIIMEDDGTFEFDDSIDDVIEEEPRYDVKPGDIYRLGNHTLMCGDSTNLDDVLELVGGVDIDLLETDPPYNVAIKSASGDTIKNDDMSDDAFADFLYKAFSNACAVLKPGGAFYIWHADMKSRIFRECAERAGLGLHATLVWVKSSFSLGRGDYQWQHEPCLYGWKEGAAHYFIKKRNLSTVAEAARPDFESMTKEDLIDHIYDMYNYTTVLYAPKPMADDLHPTMKPISLIRYQLKNSSKPGDKVLDLFGGSGTTLLACEELDRTCYMMEYDPKYADVIIALWEEKTGNKAQLISRRSE